MGTYLYKTDNVSITSAAPSTFTHGLGVAPAGEDGCVFVMKKTNTGEIYVTSSNSQIVALQSSVNGATCDIVVMRFHSLIK